MGLWLTTAVAGAVVVESAELHFRFELPDSFRRVLSDEKEDTVRALRRNSGGPVADVVVAKRMHGVLGRELPTSPPGSKTTFFPEKWHSFEIAVGRATEDVNGVPCVVFNAQIPLKPEAIQLKIVGPLSEETRLRQLLAATLSTFSGATNWQTTEERWEQIGSGAGELAGTLLMIAVFIWVLRKHSTKKQATATM